MTGLEKKRIDREMKFFTAKHFEKPSRCRDPKQIQFYIKELAEKIHDLKKHFNYVPDFVYSLLADYNRVQNQYILENFQRQYA